jgi:hypothetical protein
MIQMFSSHHSSHSNELALEYFDFAYPLVFHRHWPSIRLALLSAPKPIALVNPYSLRANEIKANLTAQGAIDLLRFDNEQLQIDYSNIRSQIAYRDDEYRLKKLLAQQEKRRLLGTSDLKDNDDSNMNVNRTKNDDDDDDDDDNDQIDDNVNDDDDDNGMNSFNQPEPVQRLDEIYRKALEQHVNINMLLV